MEPLDRAVERLELELLLLLLADLAPLPPDLLRELPDPEPREPELRELVLRLLELDARRLPDDPPLEPPDDAAMSSSSF